MRIGRYARPEIKQFAENLFGVVRDDILAEYADKRTQVLTQVRRTGNSGGYLACAGVPKSPTMHLGEPSSTFEQSKGFA